ncbi:MAG: hypothetical protein M0017_00050, partial [Desulfobacteraceae bacterium]|nr:hypothetical protein [Desulfobacteraceae bacterium]
TPFFLQFTGVTIINILRDRVLHMLFGATLLLLFLVPAFSLFSMRQVQPLAITLSLSTISLILLVVSILLGCSSIWRDVERRYTASVLGLPIPRGSYVVGKFLGVVSFLFFCGLLLGTVASGVIVMAGAQYPSQQPILWANFASAVFFDCCKYALLTAVALLLSSLSTSFFLPIFGTIATYLAGTASQEVMDYIGGGTQVIPVAKATQYLARGAYYLLPNLSAFDLKVYAIYSLPLSLTGLMYTFGYFLVYTAILLYLAVWVFRGRELT